MNSAGCCRYVWNQSLAHCNQLYANGNNKPSYVNLTKQFITQACAGIVLVKGSCKFSITTISQRFRKSLQKLL
ncbi:helix-turn-helix domain-containing protein [Okeania sp. SIO3I5]|uniref:helix-turn-helix domain-containing protein n=1 Tax=Okeania sp. SIO3I5 TaxID=2607805 RepID=UPI003427C30F